MLFFSDALEDFGKSEKKSNQNAKAAAPTGETTEGEETAADSEEFFLYVKASCFFLFLSCYLRRIFVWCIFLGNRPNY